MIGHVATMMQATISAHRLPQYQERLTAGAMYSIADFYVARCAQNFRLSDSSLMIRFNKSTSFDEIDDPVSAFPEEAFRFRDQSELLGLANTNTQLPDIIGEILSVKSTVTDPPEEKNRVLVAIKMDSNDTVTLSLFVLKLLLSTNNLRPCVLIRRLVVRDTGLASAAPLLRSHAKVEKMTIAELNSFIVSAGSQHTVSVFTCGRCNNSHAVGALRYRVEMAIADDTAEGTFVWFDGVMMKLHSLQASEAVQMLAEDGVNPEDCRIPPFIADMEGKSYIFQVRVTAFNFTEHHKTFTITCIAEELGRAPVDDNGGGDDDDNDVPLTMDQEFV
ncbi:hypothetical protein Bca4012_045215 [Brassica carinata]